MTSSVLSSDKPNRWRQRERLGVQLARDDREVVVDELGPHAGADAAAVMDRRAHRLEQRLHPREVGVRGADHEQALAAIGVARQAADRCVREAHPRAAAAAASRSVTSGSIVLMSTTSVPGLACASTPSPPAMTCSTIAEFGEHRQDDIAGAGDVVRAARRAGAERGQRADGLGVDVVDDEFDALAAEVRGHGPSHAPEPDEADRSHPPLLTGFRVPPVLTAAVQRPRDSIAAT